MSTADTKAEKKAEWQAKDDAVYTKGVALLGFLGIALLALVFGAFVVDQVKGYWASHHQETLTTITCAVGGKEHDYGVVTDLDTSAGLITFKDSAGVSYEAPRDACIVATVSKPSETLAEKAETSPELPGPHRHFSQYESRVGAEPGDVWETDKGQYVFSRNYHWISPSH